MSSKHPTGRTAVILKALPGRRHRVDIHPTIFDLVPPLFFCNNGNNGTVKKYCWLDMGPIEIFEISRCCKSKMAIRNHLEINKFIS